MVPLASLYVLSTQLTKKNSKNPKKKKKKLKEKLLVKK